MKNQTDDELILGLPPQAEEKTLSEDIFLNSVQYLIKTKNTENIVTGGTIKNLLPLTERKKLLKGLKEVVYKNFIIQIVEQTKKVIKEEIKETKEEIKKEVKKTLKKTTKKKAGK